MVESRTFEAMDIQMAPEERPVARSRSQFLTTRGLCIIATAFIVIISVASGRLTGFVLRGSVLDQSKRVIQKVVRVMQWNVFEDGLTDSPGNLGFSSGFDKRFTTLLQELSVGANNETFWGFRKIRDFTQLPPVEKVNCTRAFFGFIDVVYSALYHCIGGEARFGHAAPGDSPDLKNSLRTLFLHTKLSGAKWSAPRFEDELAKVSAPNDVADHIRQLKTSAFVSTQGYLVWDRSLIDGIIWKRQDNIWRDEWLNALKVFRETLEGSAPNVEASAKQALSKFMQIYGTDPGHQEMTSLIGMVVDAQGTPQQIRSLTLHSAVRSLLLQLCRHSLDNPKAVHAIQDFVKAERLAEKCADAKQECIVNDAAIDLSNLATESAEARMAMILPFVFNAIEVWHSKATLTIRHERVCEVVQRVAPDIATLVEYDSAWQNLSAPRNYTVVAGKGSAAILFDATKFETVRTTTEVPLAHSITPLDNISPKSSCVQLFRRIEDRTLFLVAAVHLVSGPASVSSNVRTRQMMLRAALAHLYKIAKDLKTAGMSSVVILGGDFNALAEEFLYGTATGEFWNSKEVRTVQPPLRHPAHAGVAPPKPPLAEYSDGWNFLYDVMRLREVSRSLELSCTRAGKNVVIDYVLVGGTDDQVVKFTPLQIPTSAEIRNASNKNYGIYNSVMHWGSDHLPVASEIRL